jgi:hypothetical protein
VATFSATKIAAAVLAQLRAEKLLKSSVQVEPWPELVTAVRAAAGDCLAHCQDDEPIFVLCARDLTAPRAVEAWAAGVSEYPEPDDDKIRGARECADAMARWPGPKKLPGKTQDTKRFSNVE